MTEIKALSNVDCKYISSSPSNRTHTFRLNWEEVDGIAEYIISELPFDGRIQLGERNQMYRIGRCQGTATEIELSPDSNHPEKRILIFGVTSENLSAGELSDLLNTVNISDIQIKVLIIDNNDVLWTKRQQGNLMHISINSYAPIKKGYLYYNYKFMGHEYCYPILQDIQPSMPKKKVLACSFSIPNGASEISLISHMSNIRLYEDPEREGIIAAIMRLIGR